MAQQAVKTLQAIEAAFQKDQGAVYRGLLEKLLPDSPDAYDTSLPSPRKHLGASLIGRKCTRELWYKFHWAKTTKHSGRMLRLFNRGHLEEPRMIALMMMIGCKVWQTDDKGNQFRISDESGHFGGSLDSVILGIPELPETPILGEYKTHNAKSFGKLLNEGLRATKWEHFVQMQIYMGQLKLTHGLYLAVNKDTDELYAEIIQYEREVHIRYYERAIFIIKAEKAPGRLSDNPSWFECKFCDEHGICHGKDAPAVNCRTCISAQVVPEQVNSQRNLFWCNLHRKLLTVDEQRKGCQNHIVNPEIKPPF
jgi:hypothetical protein